MFLNGPSICPWPSQISHTKWSCLVELTTLIWLVNLLVMPTKIPTYLPSIYLPMSYLPKYVIPTYLLYTYLFINLFIDQSINYLPTYLYFT